MTIVPDYQDLLKIETKRKDTEDLSHLLGVQEPYCRRMCIWKKYWTEHYYRKKIGEYENKLEDLIQRPLKSSGHAFIVLDSFPAMAKCLTTYWETTCSTIKLLCNELKDRCRWCFWKQAYDKWEIEIFRDHTRESRASVLAEWKQGVTLLMNQAKDPIDLIWTNMGGIWGVVFF